MIRKHYQQCMKQFRLPRKIKKSLRGNLWLYPADEKGNSLMECPGRSAKDYKALRDGVVKNSFSRKDSEERQREHQDKLDKEVLVSDEELKRYVNTIFHKDFRSSSYHILLEAKNHPRAIAAYYNFVNAYQ